METSVIYTSNYVHRVTLLYSICSVFSATNRETELGIQTVTNVDTALASW